MDRVGGSIPAHQLGQRFEHGMEHAGRAPSPIASEHAVPLAIFVGHMPRLCAGPRDPHHAFKIGAVILRRAMSPTLLRRQNWPGHIPFFVGRADPPARG